MQFLKAIVVFVFFLPLALSAQNYYGGIPALFDDFSYTNSEYFPEGDSTNSIFGNNNWLKENGVISSRAWHRFNRDNPDNFGKGSYVLARSPGISLIAEKGFRFGDVTPVFDSGFLLKEGTYVSRIRFGALPEEARAIQAFWMGSLDHYRFKRGADSITYVNEVDFEWNNHFRGQGISNFNVANIGAYHTKNGLIGKGNTLLLFQYDIFGNLIEITSNQQSVFKKHIQDQWCYFFIRIDSNRRAVEYYFETDVSDQADKIFGGSHLIGKKTVAPQSIKEHYPRTPLPVIYNFGMWNIDPKDTLLKSNVAMDIDWFYHTPRTDVELPALLKEVENLRLQNITRINTTGIPLDHDFHKRIHTVSIEGADSISPIQPTVYDVRPSFKGALYDIEYSYRRYTVSGIESWIPVDTLSATIYARAADTAIEIQATVKDFWRNHEVTATKMVKVVPFKSTTLPEVFPNPGDGLFIVQLTLEFDKGNIGVEIYNLSGKLVRKYSTTESKFLTIDVMDQPPGEYFLKISSDTNTYIQQITLTR